jgi:hypothetical protein
VPKGLGQRLEASRPWRGPVGPLGSQGRGEEKMTESSVLISRGPDAAVDHTNAVIPMNQPSSLTGETLRVTPRGTWGVNSAELNSTSLAFIFALRSPAMERRWYMSSFVRSLNDSKLRVLMELC